MDLHSSVCLCSPAWRQHWAATAHAPLQRCVIPGLACAFVALSTRVAESEALSTGDELVLLPLEQKVQSFAATVCELLGEAVGSHAVHDGIVDAGASCRAGGTKPTGERKENS